MDVRLISNTNNPEDVIFIAAKTCYSDKEYLDLKIAAENLESRNNLLRKVRESGHLSTYEHASFTFRIDGVSRTLLAQITRHRIASYSVQSQRYCGVNTDNIWNVDPDSIKKTRRNYDKVSKYIEYCEKLYNELLEEGIPKEDARFYLPEGTKTNIVLTMNARELLHLFSLRCCVHAQWEIRELADNMLNLVKTVAPVIFEKAGASCEQRGFCPEGNRGCGKKPTIENLLRMYENQKSDKED